MEAISFIPSLVDLFAAIGGFATVYGAVKVARTFVTRWRAAAAFSRQLSTRSLPGSNTGRGS